MTNSERATLPTIFVIFGMTGDLAHRKLIPALFHLYRRKLLPSLFQVVGFSRQELTNEEVQKKVRDIIGVPPEDERELVEKFSRLFIYKQGLFEDATGYERLAEYLGQKDGAWRVCSNKLFYLAVPPEYYEPILRHLDKSKLTEPCSPEEGWTRVIVEKPFGKDLETAEALDLLLGRLFREEQIYRIDHYLGKETVQNILAFRFSNSFLAPAWDRRYIERVTIRAWEKIGIERRGEFYEGVGALRDFGQNHLLQLLALIAMEKPATFDAASIRAARLAALRTLRSMTANDIKKRTVRGQYDGYRETKGVSSSSQTET
ncbi:MAG TPA: glucose-6-phosphate dehydrogenase, partial [Candidatus Paceibacterota bacterium]|nr:glucose-6-phosphate dehydrogenase [Candidatus Paceibacterota bacterium]